MHQSGKGLMTRRLPRFLADDEPEKLLRATKRERDRVLLILALYCGLRVSELTKLHVADLDLARRLLFVRQGKGGKDRTVPLPQKIITFVRGWIGSRTDGLVFPSREGGGSLTNRAVQLLFKKLAVVAGLPGAREARRVTPHKFRNAYASRLLESGAAIHEVRDLLGHASLAVTDLYSHASAHRLAQAVERL
jgi:integrase/recombinase XerD